MNLTSTKLLVVSLLFFASPIMIFAQNALLKGQLLDANTKEPLIGATVKTKSMGTVTNYEGNYELSLPEGEHIVEFSYLGYQTQTTKVMLQKEESKTFNITLKEGSTILQTATVTSGKYEKPLGEVTVSMAVIKPKLVEAVNTTSIDQVLQKVPGVNIIDGQANIRGGSGWSYGAGSRVLLLVDDIPALQADAGFPNWVDIPVESLGQIEVVKGAASALYGSSAMNGIINVRTAYATSKPETKVATFFTTFLDPKNKDLVWYDAQPYEAGVSVMHRQKIKKLDLVVSGYGLTRESFREDNYSDYGRFTLGTRYRITDKLTLGFNSNFNRGKSQSYFYWKGWGNDALRGDTTSFSKSDRFRYTIDPFVTYFDNSGNRHKFIGRYYRINNKNDNNQSNFSNLLYSEYQFQRKFEKTGLVVTAGLVNIYTGVKAILYGDTTYTIKNLAGYAQLDQKLFDKLNLSVGMRYERNAINSPAIVGKDTIPNDGKIVESKPVFRFGANYQVHKATYLRASWGQGYRYPTIAEKFIVTNAGAINVIPNPQLESETGWTAEIGIKQGFRWKGWEGFVDLAAFQSEYNNMMEFTFVPLANFQSQNVGNTRIKGIDASIVAQGQLFGTQTSLLTGYTYIDPKFKEFTAQDSIFSSVDYNVLKYRYKHTFKFDIESRIGNFSIGFAGNYNSHMEAVDYVFELFLPGLTDQRLADTNGSKTFDARIAYYFGKNTKLSLIGKNIFNELYTQRPALLEAPTNITMRFDTQF